MSQSQTPLINTVTGKNILRSSALRCKDLYEYLKSLSPDILNKLYHNPPICLAVFRELPIIARHYVMRLLFVEQPVPQAVIASWCSKLYAEEHEHVVQVLNELNVWKETAIPGGMPGWILNNTFKKHLKITLLGGGRPWTMSNQLETDSKPRDVAFLDSYAMERWECVLYYMVGSKQVEGISIDAVRIMLHAGLMKVDEENGIPVITQAGFQFLLLDTSAQVWYFILQYLDTIEAKGLDLVECLTFLFQLNFSTLGKDYSTEGMSEGLLTFLQHLREFGLVYQRKRKAGRFYPTRLALNITTGQNKPLTRDSVKDKYIILQTNGTIIAYTSSDLQMALLALFCKMINRTRNAVFGIITRDSIRQALQFGITAAQIIGYLQQHAFNQLIKKGSKELPPTIIDQIKLWEIEKERFVFTEGVLYSQFLSQVEFETLQDHATSSGILVWQSERKRTLVVTKAGHEEVKKFWKGRTSK